MATCQGNITHTFVNRNLHTVSKTFRMPSPVSGDGIPSRETRNRDGTMPNANQEASTGAIRSWSDA